MRFTVEVDPKTMAEIERKINSLLDPFEARDVENELYAAMRPLDRQVRQNIRSMTKRHTGNLLRGVKSSRGKRRHRLFSWAFVAMDYKKAPHSYLVEYGHEIVGHKPGLRRTGKFTRPVGYFRAAWETAREQVGREATERLSRLIQRQIDR